MYSFAKGRLEHWLNDESVSGCDAQQFAAEGEGANLYMCGRRTAGPKISCIRIES